MTPLPIDSSLPQIVERLRERRALVLVAEPGAGKTTRVPPAVLEADLLTAEHPNIVMLQPRRVAARAAAERIADERGWTLGREVGYHVRFDRKLTDATRLRVLTEGILTRQLLDDPFLTGTGAVILDEFHERSIHTDLTIALLREIRSSVRPDLVLLVMSATLDAEPVATFLGDAPVVRVPGRTFPVEIKHESRLGLHVNEHVIDSAAQILSRNEAGDILIFLPGAGEIRRAMRSLEPLAALHHAIVLPLHGSLTAEEQRRALRRPPDGVRKIICATNIAETSLTIDGVRFVIDTGLARIAGYDARRGLDRLELKRISQASAKQRAGRAGRTAAGECVRLWSAKEFHGSPAFELPEIQRVDLAQTVLALHAWGHADPRTFPWYQPPPERAIASAERLLAMLGALNAESNGHITTVGRAMLALPAHPRLARMLVAAVGGGLLPETAALAAILSEKDFMIDDLPPHLQTSVERGPSDLIARMVLLDRIERSKFDRSLRDEGIDTTTARQVARVRDELLRSTRTLLPQAGPSGPGRSLSARPGLEGPAWEEEVLKLVLLAYPDRVARRRRAETATLVGGSGVRLSKRSAVHDWEFFIAADARHDERNPANEAVVRLASGIKPGWLEELFPDSVRREKRVRFDEPSGRVIAEHIISYHDLILRTDPNANLERDDVERALIATLALPDRAAKLVQEDEQLSTLIKRLHFLERALPSHLWPGEGWPADANEALVAEACIGASNVASVKQNLHHLMHAKMTHAHRKALDDHAPQSLIVPSGNHIKLDWSAASIEPLRGPVLAVRLQELFGMTETPRVAGGTVSVIVHLLGPNYRPVQITDDLKSFWSTTYFQVRKDLRVRYPKHSWPEDPLSAMPEAKGLRRRTP